MRFQAVPLLLLTCACTQPQPQPQPQFTPPVFAGTVTADTTIPAWYIRYAGVYTQGIAVDVSLPLNHYFPHNTLLWAPEMYSDTLQATDSLQLIADWDTRLTQPNPETGYPIDFFPLYILNTAHSPRALWQPFPTLLARDSSGNGHNLHQALNLDGGWKLHLYPGEYELLLLPRPAGNTRMQVQVRFCNHDRLYSIRFPAAVDATRLRDTLPPPDCAPEPAVRTVPSH